MAVHIGVYILIEALKKVYEVPHTKELLQILTHTAVEMARGEVAQLASMFDTEQTIESYNYRIERKTALLIAICCHPERRVAGRGGRVLPLWAPSRHGVPDQG